MNSEYGILVDKNVIVDFCLSNRYNCPSRSFFNYLEYHRGLGLATEDIMRSSKIIIRKESRKVLKNRHLQKEARKTFHRIRTFLKKENISYSKNKENLVKVKKIFDEFLENNRGNQLIHPWTVTPRFRKIAKQFYLGQIAKEPNRDVLRMKASYVPVENEDIVMIANAATLKEKYNNMFLASFDPHITDDLVSSAIRDEFGVICDAPSEILSQLKECQTFI